MDLVCLPKTCDSLAPAYHSLLILSSYRNRPVDFDTNVKYIKNSLRLASPEMETIKTCARENGIAVSLGFSENDDDSLYIAQALIGADGEVRVHRRKMKPTHMERTIFGDAAGGGEGGSGSCLASVAQLPFARVGQLSCWEHIQPLLKFNTISQREQIHVAAWPSLDPHSGSGPDLWSMSAEGKCIPALRSTLEAGTDNLQGCQSLARVYAVEATAFVLHCTAVMTDKAIEANGTAGSPLMGAAGGGSSAIFGPDGRRLTEPLGAQEEGIIYADLDLDEITRIKMFAHCTGHYSRPDLMWLSVDSNAKSLVKAAGGPPVKGDEKARSSR